MVVNIATILLGGISLILIVLVVSLLVLKSCPSGQSCKGRCPKGGCPSGQSCKGPCPSGQTCMQKSCYQAMKGMGSNNSSYYCKRVSSVGGKCPTGTSDQPGCGLKKGTYIPNNCPAIEPNNFKPPPPSGVKPKACYMPIQGIGSNNGYYCRTVPRKVDGTCPQGTLDSPKCGFKAGSYETLGYELDNTTVSSFGSSEKFNNTTGRRPKGDGRSKECKNLFEVCSKDPDPSGHPSFYPCCADGSCERLQEHSSQYICKPYDGKTCCQDYNGSRGTGNHLRSTKDCDFYKNLDTTLSWSRATEDKPGDGVACYLDTDEYPFYQGDTKSFPISAEQACKQWAGPWHPEGCPK